MKPPGLATWLLARLLDPAAAEAVTGDLDEEFGRRMRAGRRSAARRWFWRQALASIVACHAGRWRAHSGHVEQPRRFIMDVFWREVTGAWRSLRRSPGFTLAAIGTLAAAIGLNTAVFSVVHATLLRPLPYPEAGRLVMAGESDDRAAVSTTGYATFLDWRARATGFDRLSAMSSWAPTLMTDAGAERLSGLRVTSEYFDALGVSPALGRLFAAEDDTWAGRTSVVLSDTLWRRQFNADSSIVGRTVNLSGVPYRVLGVLPASYDPLVEERYYNGAEIWSPLGYDTSKSFACRTCRHLRVMARLKPGISADAAEADLTAVQGDLAREYPDDYGRSRARVVSFTEVLTAPVRLPLLVLLGAVTLVLLVACANVASLTLARASARDAEFAVRAALGAGRIALGRQVLFEGAMIAAGAAAIGVLVASGLSQWLTSLAPADLPRLTDVSLNGTVLAYTVAVAVTTALTFAIVPAIQASGRAVRQGVSRVRVTDGRESVRLRESLVIADITVAVVLVAGAGLMIRSVNRLLDVNPGFNPAGVTIFHLSLVGPRWGTDAPVVAFQRDLVERIRALPGVTATALAGQVPLDGNRDTWGTQIEGRTDSTPDFERYSVTPDYFRTMGVPLVRGRLIDDADGEATMPVMVVSETAARRVWADRDPIGQRVRIGPSDSPWRTVVGVAGDVHHYGLDAAPAPQMYLPQSQVTDSFLTLVVRATTPIDQLAAGVRSTVRALAKDVPVYGVQPMDALVAKSAAPRRFTMLLLSIFASLTLALTVVGLYGVVAFSVSRRQREMGIRIALGAGPAAIRRLILGRGLWLTLTGAVFGVGLAVLASRQLASQLFGVTPLDPVSLGAAALTLLTASTAAHIVPMRRAIRVPPSTALRLE
jgi:putative ABC transport system permease protein